MGVFLKFLIKIFFKDRRHSAFTKFKMGVFLKLFSGAVVGIKPSPLTLIFNFFVFFNFMSI
ncbi:hypothetical protein A7985_25220 [Pseudoalteromonas luteoviolacea]|uniref:Uncharacterized protein n=1 Tax=Pseudoalteromonas luteoviolacea TaxID=43657 RepID=A0A1C0TJ16_9GAMM|nr:hypothetical protein A7985_25220 [Pseudoalteromonas luteoviolacea]